MIKAGKFSGVGLDFCFEKGYRAKDFGYMQTDTQDSHVSFED